VKGQENRVLRSGYRARWNRDGEGEDGQRTQLATTKDSEGYEEVLRPRQLYRRFIKDFARVARPINMLT